jgi:hypothetical protein
MRRLAHFFFGPNSRVLLGGVANDQFAIEMPGCVAENRYDNSEPDKKRQRAYQKRRGHNETPER